MPRRAAARWHARPRRRRPSLCPPAPTTPRRGHRRRGARADRYRRRRRVKRVVPLSLAHIKLAATIGGQPPGPTNAVTFRMVRLDGEPREIARTIANEPQFDLSAGRSASRLARRQQRDRCHRPGACCRPGAEGDAPLEGGSVTLKRPSTFASGPEQQPPRPLVQMPADQRQTDGNRIEVHSRQRHTTSVDKPNEKT